MEVIDIREGFICPMCMKDLGSDSKLQEHFGKAHMTSEFDRDVLDNLKGLFGKAKKKLMRKDEEDGIRSTLSGSGGSSASLQQHVSEKDSTAWTLQWEGPQEIGVTKSWTDLFLSTRNSHLNYFQSETTKLLLRLEKLLSPDAPNEANKRKAYERTVVPWAPDVDVTICTTCGQSFTLLIRRRHHCRLCGCVMCNHCSHFLSNSHAKKLVESTHHDIEEFTTGGFRRSTSNSSLNSMLSPEGDVHFRCCGECRALLERRDRTTAERREKPVITLLYEKMRLHMDDIEKSLPQYQNVIQSLRMGDSKYSVPEAAKMRADLMKLYETVDLLSKRIATLGSENKDIEASVATLQLQKMVRVSTNIFLQHNLVGLENPPTEEEVYRIRETRKREAQQRIEAERAAAAANSSTKVSPSKKLDVTKDVGWKPSAPEVLSVQDPMLQQMNNIRGYLQQAKSANKWDEVEMLEQNLRELEEYWRSTQGERSTS